MTSSAGLLTFMAQRSIITTVVRTVAIALLLTATLFRACWATQLAQHDTAPVVDLSEFAAEHGHHHSPFLGHVHAHDEDSSDQSDAAHILTHAVLAVDHQAPLTLLSDRTDILTDSDYPTLVTTPLPPFPASLYRPPRHFLLHTIKRT